MPVDPWIRNPCGEVECALLFDCRVATQGCSTVIRLEYVEQFPAPEAEILQIAMMPEDALAVGKALIAAADLAVKNRKQQRH